MIRVAFTALAPFISGAERSLQVTLRHLPKAGIDPIVVGPETSQLAGWCERERIPFVARRFAFRDKWHPFRWWSSVRGLRTLFRDYRVDVVHSNQMWSFPAAGVAAASIGLPQVLHLRDEAEPGVLSWCCPTLPNLAICISRHIAMQAEAAWSQTERPRIETRINPVELPSRLGREEDKCIRAKAKRSFGLSDDELVFGFIGQIRESKGLLGLFEALANLPKNRRWTVLIAGRNNQPGSTYEQQCRDRADRPDLSGRVHFLGFLDDTTAFYRAIDVAVIPSQEEPMGRIPLEAAAHSRPSVAFSVGGLPDVVLNGETGWLVPANDWGALANRLTELFDEDHAKVGIVARDWVEKASDPDCYARWLADLYRELLHRNSPSKLKFST
jgi:glycosyltransferase involved in cell wall biosynthesis